MKWKKYGQIFNIKQHKLPLNCIHHAQSPQAISLKDRIRIYFSTRSLDKTTKKFLSHVAFVDYDLSLHNIIGLSQDEIIPLGERGCFDEHGIFPFSPFQDGDRLKAYSCGWSRRSSVSVETSTGFAESFDHGKSFQKLGSGPVFSSSLYEPFLVGDSFVRKFNDQYHMWYMFGQKWVQENDSSEPDRVYKIGHAISNDGISWKRDYKKIIPDILHENECQALPSVVYYHGLYHMVFCYRDVFGFRHDKTKSYRLGYAYSPDLISWTRNDRLLGLNTGADGEWDSDMMCYPCFFAHNNRLYIFYNGNEFGRHGFGMAELIFTPNFKNNNSNANDIKNHLESCNSDFINQLKSRVEISEYSEKLATKAQRIEAWHNDSLIGLIAMYHNSESDKFFISDVSVSKDFEKNGIASQLLTIGLNQTKNKIIELEVHKDNLAAISLYKKFGFYIKTQNEHNYIYMQFDRS